MQRHSTARNLAQLESGSALIELALILPLLLLLFMGIVDLGRAFYYSNAVARAAEVGALYGARNPTDTSGMVDASDHAMSAAFGGAKDSTSMDSSASYGCECNGGTSQSPGCTVTPSCGSDTNQVYYVTVTANAAFQPILPWPGVPSSFNLSSTVTMRGGA